MMCHPIQKVPIARTLENRVTFTTALVTGRYVSERKDGTATRCYFLSSQNELCVAPGPGKDMFDSTKIIATKQFEMGKVTQS